MDLTGAMLVQKESQNVALSRELKSTEEALKLFEENEFGIMEKLRSAEREVAGMEVLGSRNKWVDRYYQCVKPLEEGCVFYWDAPDGTVSLCNSCICPQLYTSV